MSADIPSENKVRAFFDLPLKSTAADPSALRKYLGANQTRSAEFFKTRNVTL